MIKLFLFGGLLLGLVACTSKVPSNALDAYLGARMAVANVTLEQQRTATITQHLWSTSRNLRIHPEVRQTAQRLQQINVAVLKPLQAWLAQEEPAPPPLLPDSIRRLYWSFFEGLYQAPPAGSYFTVKMDQKAILRSIEVRELAALDSLYEAVAWTTLAFSEYQLLAQCYYNAVESTALSSLDFIYYFIHPQGLDYDLETAFVWTEVLTPTHKHPYPIKIAVEAYNPTTYEITDLQLNHRSLPSLPMHRIQTSQIGMQQHRLTFQHQHRLTAAIDTTEQVFQFFVHPTSNH